jgi:uncharacterized membrane protein YkgB
MSTRIETQSAFSVPSARAAASVDSIGLNVLRYSLVFIFLIFGSLKFTAAEAAAVKPLLSNSPFMSWMYGLLSDQGVSNAIGVSELVTAALLALRPVSARAGVVGGALAVATFVTTVSFLFTTPGALSFAHPANGFLLKDVVFLGASIALATEALRAAAAER